MSEKLVRTILRISLWVLMIVSVVLIVMFVINTNAAGDDKIALKAAANPLIVWAYILIAIAAVTAILFPVGYLIRNPRKAVKALISIALLALVFFIGYLLADSTPIHTATSNTNPDFSDRGVLLLTDTGIITTYIMLCIAVLALLVTGVRGIIRR